MKIFKSRRDGAKVQKQEILGRPILHEAMYAITGKTKGDKKPQIKNRIKKAPFRQGRYEKDANQL